MKIDFRLNKPAEQIVKEAVGGRKTLLFMAKEAKRLMDPYVPALNNVLSQKVRTYVEDDSGIVHYISPYAHYQHEGYLMVSRITGCPWAKKGESKVMTGRRLEHNKSKHILATSEWEKAMKAARMEDFTRAVQRYVKGR